MHLHEKIAEAKISLMAAKPRSRRRVEMELTLRDLMVRQLKQENRQDKKSGGRNEH
jgi:hypothetical protein